MDEILVKLWPIFAGFAVAYIAKRLGLVKASYGSWLLKFAFYSTIPALIFVSALKLQITQHLIVFVILPGILLSITFLVCQRLYKRFSLPKATEGTFRVAPLTINSGFTLPFLLSVFGGEGLARLILFNAGFNPLLLIGVYGLAASYNPKNKRRRDGLKRVLITPPLWALILGLVLNGSSADVPAWIISVLSTIGGLTSILIIASLGMIFEFKRPRLDKTMAIIGLRMGLGLVIGLAICLIFNLKGLDRTAVLVLSSAPIGFNLMTFAAVEKLDQELAANAISLSLVISLVTTPLIILFTS